MKKLLLPLILLSASAGAVEQDKVLHAGVSTVIGGIAYTYTESWTKSMSACMAVGLAKELIDEHDYGGFDTQDLVADGVGCVLGTFISDTFIVTSDGEETSITYKVKF